MLRMFLALAGAGLLSTSLGCSMCCAPFDTAFAAYGGAVERDDLYHGRVGSIFEPAAARTVSYEQADDSIVIEPESAFEPMEPIDSFQPADETGGEPEPARLEPPLTR